MLLIVHSLTLKNLYSYELETVYWNIKPFIFTNEYGEIDGIIPKIFEAGVRECANDTQYIGYISEIKSRSKFLELVRSNTSYGMKELANITRSKAFWIPVFTYEYNHEVAYLVNRSLMSFHLIKSDKIAVIVPRFVISLPIKIIRGVLGCQKIFVIAMLLCVLVGIIMWGVDHKRNKKFPGSFLPGIATGFWWSFISMATVGYGDVVPKTKIGKSGAIVWLFIGVMVGSVMTATMTQIVRTADDITIYGKEVAVLEDSYEYKVASNDYRAVVRSAKSYDDAIEMVRRGEVYATVINADVAAWYHDEIVTDDNPNPLRIAHLLSANLNVNCFLSTQLPREVKKFFQCMYNNSEEVYNIPKEQFDRPCHTQKLYIDSVGDLILRNMFVQIMLGILCILLLLGFVVEKLSTKGINKNNNQGMNKQSCWSGQEVWHEMDFIEKKSNVRDTKGNKVFRQTTCCESESHGLIQKKGYHQWHTEDNGFRRKTVS